VTASFAALRGPVLRLALAFLAALLAGSCGSGAVGPVVNDPTRITVLPATATLYSGLPTTFTLSGGTGAYIVSSSNQAIIPVDGGIISGPLVVVPNQVLADTPVTLTVRDTGNTALATATLTVRPGTVNNDITITPTGTQATSCAPAVCSGGDALVKATISLGGVPLGGHVVRMEVVSGDFRFITTPPGSSVETLSTVVDVTSDAQGKVQARIRTLADAANQTALVQVTDLSSGSFQRASFFIAQSTGTAPGFFVSPTSAAFAGRFTGQCPDNVSAAFYVFGGSPPYSILNSLPSAFTLSDNVVFSSGDGFTVTARGVCNATAVITIRDSAGHTTTVNVSNTEGTDTPTPISVAPDHITLADCTATASVTIAGGARPYFVSSGSNALTLTLSQSTFTIRRRIGSAAPASPIIIGVSDGRTTAEVTVDLVPPGDGPC
jgi:hypothetical protein